MKNHPACIFLAGALCAACSDGGSAATSSDLDGGAPDAMLPEASTLLPDGGDAAPGREAGAMSDAAAPRDAGAPFDAARPPDPCALDGGCPPGTWVDVTPPGVSLTDGACGNYGVGSVQVDPVHPEQLYAQLNCQGIWRSTDYGQTWKGPINTGANGSTVSDCAGGITLATAGAPSPPIVYQSCIRGAGTGFWRSTNGGVDFTRYAVGPGGARQDFYPPVADPHDAKHLLMCGHEMNVLVQSTDGGETWTSVTTDPGMTESGGTGAIFFVDTGDPATTKSTWLWMAQGTGGSIGTWRTSNGGASWTQVDKTEHPHGFAQIYQPDAKGTLYLAGVYSALGWGVVRSSDYGQTFTHVGPTSSETIVFGTAKKVYAMYGWPIGAGQTVDPTLIVGDQPGTGTWTMPGTPSAMSQGPDQAAVTSDGTHAIIVTANLNAGLWRYVEP